MCLLTPSTVHAAEPSKPVKDSLHVVKPEMELLITHPSVLESPEARYPGALSFGHIMEQLAGKEQAGNFALEWLNLWLQDQTVNGDVAPARPKIQELVLDSWRKVDQAANDEDDDPFNWTPNLAHAPFKLIAVVNRMDLVATNLVATMKSSAESVQKDLSFLSGNLFAFVPPPQPRDFISLNELFRRDSLEGKSIVAILEQQERQKPSAVRKTKEEGQSAYVASVAPVAASTTASFGYYGNGGGTGEGRLVFALTDSNGVPVEPGFNVIFEFTLSVPVPKPDAKAAAILKQDELIKLWAAKWHHLGTHEQFGPEYLKDLIEVTKGFTESRGGISASDAPIPPPLAQLRTNDGVLEAVRELRQFGLLPASPGQNARLRLSPVSQTPAESFHAPERSAVLAKVLKPQSESLRKNLTITIPTAVQLPREKEPTGVLGARALLPGVPKDFRWEVPAARDRAVVKELSLHSCNGCHGADTACDNGCHLKAGPGGTQLSAFLSPTKDGLPVGEMKERAFVLKTLLEVDKTGSKAALLKLLQQRHRSSH